MGAIFVLIMLGISLLLIIGMMVFNCFDRKREKNRAILELEDRKNHPFLFRDYDDYFLFKKKMDNFIDENYNCKKLIDHELKELDYLELNSIRFLKAIERLEKYRSNYESNLVNITRLEIEIEKLKRKFNHVAHILYKLERINLEYSID